MFSVVLDTETTEDVSIGLSSSDTTEGTVAPFSLTFTRTDWNVAQTVTVTGVDDALADGDVAYTIITNPASSADPGYSGLNPADVSVTNQDIDLPGRIEAEDYKEGGEGVGYHDTDAGNQGGEYRNDDVDIQTTSDIGGGFNVGWIRDGEWLAYDVMVTQSGLHDIIFRVASSATGTKVLHVEVDGVDVTGSVSFTHSDGWQTWHSETVTEVILTAGVHELKVVMDVQKFNLNYMDVVFTDDDPAPSLSINDVTVTEGNSGSVNADFTLSLSAASGQTVTVNYATADGSATAPGDYTASSSSTLTFNPGETSKTVTVVVNGDTLVEPDETFFVNLSNPTNATLADSQGQGTITDNDPAPSLSINDVTVTEGNSGSVNADFTLSLSAASGQTVTVNYATADGSATAPGDATADGSATAPGDYTASSSSTLTFNPGETSKTVTVVVNGDTLVEPDETFFVNLSNPTNATLADSQGQGTITDNDPAPSLSINDVTVTEGNSGSVNADFTLSLSAASGQTVTVNYATADGSATAPGDYTASSSSTLTFNPGETSKTVTVVVNGDTLVEPDETFFVNLSNPTNATLADSQGQGTITDNDPAPSLSINDVTVTEGNSGSVNADFTLSLSAASGQTVTVNYATADGSATAPGDYTASSSSTLTFNPGETSKTVTVVVNGDTLVEPDETFFVNLSNPTNATLADSQGQGTITDDDPAPSLSINDVTVTEGNSGSVNADFTLSLSAASGQTVTVNYATAPGDYTASSSSTLTFNPGETSKTVTVVVNGDTLVEPDETFFVNLSNPTNATLADSQGQGTITDDDPAQPQALSVTIQVRKTPESGDQARFYVWVEDSSGNPVDGASIALTLDTGGQNYTQTRTTHQDGRASFRFRTRSSDSLPWTITAMASKDGAIGSDAITYNVPP